MKGARLTALEARVQSLSAEWGQPRERHVKYISGLRKAGAEYLMPTLFGKRVENDREQDETRVKESPPSLPLRSPGPDLEGMAIWGGRISSFLSFASVRRNAQCGWVHFPLAWD